MNLTKYKRSLKEMGRMIKREEEQMKKEGIRDTAKHQSLCRAKRDCSNQIKRLRQEKKKK